ncbi:MAG: hypothetical protein ACRYFX_10945 [Janthinobacterium lividum]
MFLNLNTDPRDHSSCALSYDEQEGWIQAIWSGYVDPAEAMRGAEAYLHRAAQAPCELLLNDNSRLSGPWFDSLDWLAEVWVPQAVRLGLRYVAHIVQANQHYDVLTSRLPAQLPFELQIFQSTTDARHWLQQVRPRELQGSRRLAAEPGRAGNSMQL